MATTGLGPVVQLPAPSIRPVGTFLNTVPRVTWNDRYALGVLFQTTDFADLSYEGIPSGGPCVDMMSTITPRDFTDTEEQGAFSVLDAVTCSSIGKTYEELNADLANHWAFTISEAVARAAMYGTGGGPHSFVADAVGSTTPSSVHEGIAELEEQLALAIGNVQGMIHMSPSALVYAVTNGTVNRRGDIYYSTGGHIVVADAGYQVSETTTTIMYGTGPVWYALGERASRAGDDWEFNDWTHNDLLSLEQAYGIILYDPDVVFKTTATRA